VTFTPGYTNFITIGGIIMAKLTKEEIKSRIEWLMLKGREAGAEIVVLRQLLAAMEVVEAAKSLMEEYIINMTNPPELRKSGQVVFMGKVRKFLDKLGEA
jgi:hypothetical protein